MSCKVVPDIFDAFQGYNDTKRKKVKEQPMSNLVLHGHSEALFAVLLKGIFKASPEWKECGQAILELAECLRSYEVLLKTESSLQAVRREQGEPLRQVSEFLSVEHRAGVGVNSVKPKYAILDEAMKCVPILQPLFFNEFIHIEGHFESNMQRFRYIKELQLSMPVDVYKYSPGGSHTAVLCLVPVTADRTADAIQTETAQTVAMIIDKLPQFHTSQMRRQFKASLANVISIPPSVADMVYKQPSLDATVSQHPDTEHRLRMIFMGETGLLSDLRKLNAGRPTGSFDVFFEKLGGIIDEVTAADERRQNVSHMSEWLSLNDLIDRAKCLCPPEAFIPSKALVRLKFAPRNPYLKSALNFTSKLEVQYKIQRRQLRVSHPDAHYCAAQFKYLKQLAIHYKSEKSILMLCDDKAKVPVGEPGCTISTGVRGKKCIAPTNTTVAALDHDVHHKGSLTPSVYLQCAVPEDVNSSFYRGSVRVVLNDAVFQASSPFRHAASLVKQLRADAVESGLPPIILKFSDGGTDQRNTLESVKLSLICLFRELDADLIIAARCAPGQSWTNPVERVMSILNIGLQNCALERTVGSQEDEKLLKSCGCMDDIRKTAVDHPSLKQFWHTSIEQCRRTMTQRFSRLSLKSEPIRIFNPVETTEIDSLQRHLHFLFPSLDTSRMTKAYTSRCKEYQKYLHDHCRERQYSFQIRKCADITCCGASRIPINQLQWLPDPVLDASNPGHFLPFHSVFQTDTTERDRPTLNSKMYSAATSALKRKSTTTVSDLSDVDRCESDVPTVLTPSTSAASGPTTTQSDEYCDTGVASLYTAQHAQAVVCCIECRKPRLVYSKQKLGSRQLYSLATQMSEHEYSCGSPASGIFDSNIACNLVKPNNYVTRGYHLQLFKKHVH